VQDGVVFAFLAVAKTVKNQQQHRGNRIHGHRTGSVGSTQDGGIVPFFQRGARGVLCLRRELRIMHCIMNDFSAAI
jgi:hypothetical protein